MDSPNLKRTIEERVCSDTSKECKNLCAQIGYERKCPEFLLECHRPRNKRKGAFFIDFLWPWQTRMHEKIETLASVPRHPSFLKNVTRESGWCAMF